MSKSITVLDSTFDMNFVIKMNPFAAPFTGIWAPIWVGSVEEMVNKVISKAGNEKIDSLLISGHGAPGLQSVGCGRHGFSDNGTKSLQYGLNAEGKNELLAGAAGHLRRLRDKFTSDAIISLGGCNVAKGDEGKKLLSLISRETNTYVQAGDATQRILIPGWEGNVIRCSLDTCWVAKASLI